MIDAVTKFCTELCDEHGVGLTEWQMSFLVELVHSRRPIVRKGKIFSSVSPNEDITEWCVDKAHRIADIPYGDIIQMSVLDI